METWGPFLYPIVHLKGIGNSMKVLTYTNIWSTERKIYAFGDISLPTPISFKQIGLFVLVGVPWFTLMLLFGISVTGGPWHFMLWFGPPIALSIIGNKKLLEDKSIFEYISSQIKFFFEPKDIYDGNSDNTINKEFTVESIVWQKSKKEHSK